MQKRLMLDFTTAQNSQIKKGINTVLPTPGANLRRV